MYLKAVTKIMLLSLIYINSIASTLSNQNLINQGNVNITYDDIDGFSYTIPIENRLGFFNSPVRIDQTLDSILTMKHIVNYAEENNLLDLELINKDISAYILDNKEIINQYDLNDIEFLKLKRFLYHKLAYKYMHKHFRETIKDDELLQLANEQYIIDKENYYVDRELRDLKYITIKFSENDRNQNKELSLKLLNQLKENGFDWLENNYKSDENIVFTKGVNEFYYNEKYKKFSDFVFSPDKTGVVEGVLEGEKTFIIAEVMKIRSIGYKTFEDVKPSLISGLRKKRLELDFGNLVNKLTQEEIIVDEDGIISLKTRYQKKIN